MTQKRLFGISGAIATAALIGGLFHKDDEVKYRPLWRR